MASDLLVLPELETGKRMGTTVNSLAPTQPHDLPTDHT